MSKIKTELEGANPLIVEDDPSTHKSVKITYALITCAIFILLYFVYSSWLIHQPFWENMVNRKKNKNAKEDSDSDSDSDSPESASEKKQSSSSNLVDGWDVKKAIQLIEDTQRQLISRNKKIDM